MSSKKNYAGMGHTVTRSEFEDGILRDNARHDNRLDHEKRTVEKAKRVVVRSYDKESQMLKQKMASAAQRKTTSYFSQTSQPNGISTRTSGSRTGTGRNSRLIPDYEYKYYKMKQKGDEDDIPKQPSAGEQIVVTGEQNGSDTVDAHAAENGNNDDLSSDYYVPTRRTRPPDFWNNLSTPKHQSSVRIVRERLAKEFSKPKPKPSQRSGSSQVPVVLGTRLVKK